MAHAVLEGFEVGVDGRQGRAHLVGEVGEHLTSRGFGGLESIGETVVRAGEGGELDAEAGVGDVSVIAAGGDLGGGLGDVADGALDAAAEVPRHGEGGGAPRRPGRR